MAIKAEIKPLLETLAEHIKAQRKLMGLTQAQLAEKAELSTNYVARIELGSNTPSLAALAKLAKALDLQVSDMLLMRPARGRSLDVEHLAHIFDHLDERDIQHVLKQLQSTVDHIRTIRKHNG